MPCMLGQERRTPTVSVSSVGTFSTAFLVVVVALALFTMSLGRLPLSGYASVGPRSFAWFVLMGSVDAALLAAASAVLNSPEKPLRAPATADGGCSVSLPTPRLGGDHLGWAAIFGGQPSRRLLVGLGGRLGSNSLILL